MKTNIIKITLLALMLSMLTGCELAGSIFEAGMFVGILVVVVIVGLIIWILKKVMGK